MRVLASSLVAMALLTSCSSSDSNGPMDGGPSTEADGSFSGGSMEGDDGSMPNGDGSMACASDDPDCMADGSMPGGDEDAGEDVCPTVRFESTVTVTDLPGNVLLVFDRSGTMGLDWEGQQRSTAAAGAVNEALGPIASALTVGALFFPTVDPNAEPPKDGEPVCTVGAIDDEAQIAFMPGDDFLTAFSASSGKIYAPLAAGGTPLLNALKAADTALTEANLDGITTIVLITDGAPNCGWDADEAEQIVRDWHVAGRLTYVVGLPGVSGAEAILNGLAVAGGTNKFFSPDAADALEPVLAAIAQQTVRTGLASCDVELEPAAEQPERLTMVVEEDGKEQEVERDLGNSGGWSVNAAGTIVTLEGALCQAAQTGLYDAIRFEYRCDTEPDLPTAPPPTVPVGPPEPPDPILF